MQGGCHCKAIRFEVEGVPSWTGACYCIDCRKISGAPYVVWVGYASNQLTVLQGNPKEYESSEKVIRSFCETCGSPFLYRYKESPENIFIAIGSFDNPDSLEPKEHIWVSQKLPWVHITDDFPQKK